MSFFTDLLPTIGTIGGAAFGGPLGAAVGGQLGNSIAQGQNNRDSQSANERMWRLNNEYNTPLNQRKRLREAGYSEALFYGNGTVGNSSAPATAVHRIAPQVNPETIGSVANSVADLQLKKSQTANIEANTQATLANIPKTQAETISKILENDFNKVTFNDRVSKTEQENLMLVKDNAIKVIELSNLDEKTKAEIANIASKTAEAYQTIEHSKSNVRKNKKEIQKMGSEIGLIRRGSQKVVSETSHQQIQNSIDRLELEMRREGTTFHDKALVRNFIQQVRKLPKNQMRQSTGAYNGTTIRR